MHIYQKPKKNMLREMLYAENFSCLYMKTHESIHRKEQTHTHTHTYICTHACAHTLTHKFSISSKTENDFIQTKSHRLFPIHSHFNLIIFLPPNNMFLVWGSLLPHWQGWGTGYREFLNFQKDMPWVIWLYAHFWSGDGLYPLSSSQSDRWLNETEDPLADCSSFQSKL